MKTILTLLLCTCPVMAQGIKPGPTPVKPTTSAPAVTYAAFHARVAAGTPGLLCVGATPPATHAGTPAYTPTAAEVAAHKLDAGCWLCARQPDGRLDMRAVGCPCDSCPCAAGECGSAACPTAKATPAKFRTEYRTVTRMVKQCNGNGTCSLVPVTTTEAVQVPVE